MAWVVFTAWRYAWMSDDALITLRSGLNWVHGLGPQYNATERVVGYTHPLWMLLTSLSGALTDSWIYATLYLCLALAGTAVAILVARTRNLWQFLTVSALLLMSNTVADWSTSGLEGPLAVLLVVALFSSLTREGALIRPVVTGLLAGLLLLCRLDYVLLIGPWLMMTSITLRHQVKRVALLYTALAAPVLIWAAATYAYYGFVLPATFAAKTNSVIPRSELLVRGADYIRISLGYDRTLLALGVAFVVIIVLSRARSLLVWGAGAALYLTYVMWVGGDYMLGRFFLVPTMAVLLALTQTAFPRDAGLARAQQRLLLIIPLCILALGAGSAISVRLGQSTASVTDPSLPLVDERPWWARLGRSLDPLSQENPGPGIIQSDLAFLDRQARLWPDSVPIGPQPEGSVLVRCGGLGAVGFLLPGTFVIDSCGLTDRFVASLPYYPPRDGTPWKAGHFVRDIPAGYEAAVQNDNPALVEDPDLRQRLVDLWARIRPGS